MTKRYLQITFRRGNPFAAYLYLPRPAGAKVARTLVEDLGLRVDLDAQERILGIEITAPKVVQIEDLNRLLHRFGQPALAAEEWRPALAA